MKNNKRGSAIIEATIIYPIVIMVAIGLICLMVSIFYEAESQSRLHVYTRAMVGTESGCSKNLIIGEKEISDCLRISKVDGCKILGIYFFGENSKYINYEKEMYSTENIVDEAQYVRWQNAALSRIR